MAAWMLPAELSAFITTLAGPPRGRLPWQLLPLMAGMLFAQRRRTVASWLHAAGASRRGLPARGYRGAGRLIGLLHREQLPAKGLVLDGRRVLG
jgi:hypothetical protein